MVHADVTTAMRYLHCVEHPDQVQLVAEGFALDLRAPTGFAYGNDGGCRP